MALTHDSRKSSYGNPSDCVEVAGLAGNTLVRDSPTPPATSPHHPPNGPNAAPPTTPARPTPDRVPQPSVRSPHAPVLPPPRPTVLDLRRVRRPDRSYSVEWADLEEVRVSPTREGSAHAVLLTFVEDREPDHEWSERTGVTNPRGDAPIAFLVSPDQHDEHGHPVLPRLRSALERFGPASRAAP
ncbi:DUF397 domain-containing protein [Nocardiopsis lambiniae]|uniref:DUF397 domain-containing protein n=1 Tax=Nocardiopsis lambiniae TaxID=3075539 RepID=A0ABU2M623_9ACTN|nr:DUF397 domain-containing protein [Nocardiopsis sp. DSM 44743]MDT0328029.1 DUF397 domain-containing protein [Nocardiopsis sp. DSM 44743]